jgi:hypothetical protein
MEITGVRSIAIGHRDMRENQATNPDGKLSSLFSSSIQITSIRF